MIKLLFLLIGLYFFPVIFGREVFFYGDIVSIFLPFKQFFFDNIRQGIFPLWNPYVYSGYPVFADMTLGHYYLPSWLLFFRTTIKTVSWLMVGHFFAAGYFMYRLGQWLKFPPPAAFFSAVTYTFSGIMVNYIADPQRFFVISLFPMFFYALFRGRVIFIALVLSLQIFAGHIQYVFIELIAGLFFYRRLKSLIAAGILAGLFTAAALLPMLEFIPYTTRLEAYKDLSIYQSYSLHPASLIRFVFAHFWGIKNQGSAWGTLDTSSIGYLGFLPLLLIAINFKKLIRHKQILIWLIIAALALVISFGTFLPFFKIFVTVVPIFRLFRNPMVWLSLYTFFMSLSAGAAFKIFRFNRKTSWIKWVFLTVMIMAGLTWLGVKLRPDWPQLALQQIAGIIHKPLSAFHTLETDRLIAGFILTNLIIVSLLISLAWSFQKKAIIIAAAVIDLFVFTRSNLYLTNSKYFTGDNPIVKYLQDNLGPDRFLSSSEAVPYSGLNDFFGMLDNQPISAESAGRRLQHELRLLPPNFGMVHNLSTINGYTSFVMKDYFNLFKSGEINPLYSQFSQYNPRIIERRSDLALSKIDFAKIGLNDPVFDRLAIKYFVTDRDLGLPEDQRVFQDGDVSIFENSQTQTRTVAVKLSRPNPNRLEVEGAAKGKLVVFDVNYPGWQARVNGRPVAITPYGNIFRSVEVGEDNSRVVFDFKPRSFYLGVWISLISLSLAVLARLRVRGR